MIIQDHPSPNSFPPWLSNQLRTMQLMQSLVDTIHKASYLSLHGVVCTVDHVLRDFRAAFLLTFHELERQTDSSHQKEAQDYEWWYNCPIFPPYSIFLALGLPIDSIDPTPTRLRVPHCSSGLQHALHWRCHSSGPKTRSSCSATTRLPVGHPVKVTCQRV